MSSKKEPVALHPPSTETNAKEIPWGPLPNRPETITPEAAQEMAREIIACIGRLTYPQKPDHDQEDLAIVATGVFDGLSRFIKGLDTGYGVSSGLSQAYKNIAKGFAEEYVEDTIRASCSKEESDAIRYYVAVFAIITLLMSSLLIGLGIRESARFGMRKSGEVVESVVLCSPSSLSSKALELAG